ncbi:MAG: Histone deacetylase-like amidohydrolase [Syntrophus sp. SKADARSKE-3]|nr:Histone deacetylase-like amidohydrolase [Syntrophus sp. SKADARSKE-3]
MPRKTGIVRDNRYLRHGAGIAHPESPRRLEAIHAMLDKPDMAGKFISIQPRYATHDEIALVHDPRYIDLIAQTANQDCVVLDPDTETTSDTYDTAKLAVGGALSAVDAVMNGDVGNAFAIIRPPGHHAGTGHAAGFCIFNNIAIAARYAISRYGLSRVLIADWDLHHGDGTQSIFYNDKKVLYFSTHQFPAYPGTGFLTDVGHGEGAFYTINVPMKACGDNAMYVKAYRGLLQPVAMEFKPELVLVSAGFDIYEKDPLGDMKVTPTGFAALTRIMMDIADVVCDGHLVAVLEGGYHVTGVAESVKAVLNEMHDDTHYSEDNLDRLEYEADQGKDQTIRRVMEQVEPVWQVF